MYKGKLGKKYQKRHKNDTNLKNHQKYLKNTQKYPKIPQKTPKNSQKTVKIVCHFCAIFVPFSHLCHFFQKIFKNFQIFGPLKNHQIFTEFSEIFKKSQKRHKNDTEFFTQILVQIFHIFIQISPTNQPTNHQIFNQRSTKLYLRKNEQP